MLKQESDDFLVFFALFLNFIFTIFFICFTPQSTQYTVFAILIYKISKQAGTTLHEFVLSQQKYIHVFYELNKLYVIGMDRGLQFNK